MRIRKGGSQRSLWRHPQQTEDVRMLPHWAKISYGKWEGDCHPAWWEGGVGVHLWHLAGLLSVPNVNSWGWCFWGPPKGVQGAFQVTLVIKNPLANAGDAILIPGSQRSPGTGNGNPLQYSCLENSMDRGAWQGSQRVRHDWAHTRPSRANNESCPLVSDTGLRSVIFSEVSLLIFHWH